MKNYFINFFIFVLMSQSLAAVDYQQRVKHLYSFAGELDLHIRDFFVNLSHHVSKYDEKFSGFNQNSARCMQDLGDFGEGLATMEAWALTMFDSYGKLQSGIMAGNFINLGHFDQCINIVQTLNSGLMKGQHCIILMESAERDESEQSVQPHLGPIVDLFHPMPFGTSFCVPDSCSPEIVKLVADSILGTVGLQTSDYNQETHCSVKEPPPFQPIDIVAIAIFSLFALMLAASTAYDLIMRFQKKTPNELLIGMSIYTNTGKIMDMTPNKSGSSAIGCIDGIRALSITWIMYGHRFFVTLMFPVANIAIWGEWLQTAHSPLIAMSNIAVDSFFLLSGLLVTMSVMRELEKTQKISLIKYWVFRYLRITPVLAALIFAMVTLLKFFGNGPFFGITFERFIPDCEKYWWTALLHVQNYVNPNNVCLVHSWYLSIDMQLYFIAPLFLYPLWRFGNYFVGLIPLLILGTMGGAFAVSMIHEFPAFPANAGDLEYLYTRLVYYPTHIRMGAWFVGLLLGYMLFKQNGKKIDIPPAVNITLWVVAIGGVFGIVFGMYPLQQVIDNPSGVWANSLYIAFSRVCWAICVSWIIYSCYNGSGGPINWFLSLPQWKPICRLGLPIYLIHILVQVSVMANDRQPQYFEDMRLNHLFLGDWLATFFFAIIFSLTFEIPIDTIKKTLFDGKKKKPEAISN